MRQTAVVCSLLAVCCVVGAQGPVADTWYKCNLHAHTTNSDGDSSPADVVAWYRRHGYPCLTITDHNRLTDPVVAAGGEPTDFLQLRGEEITNERGVHVNGIGLARPIEPMKEATVTQTLQASIDAVRRQNGVAIINHPNFQWAFAAAEMKPLRGPFLLEIASGHPAVNEEGDGRSPGTEQMWDELLSAGMRVFAVAADDSHNFSHEFTLERANPGRAWVVVKASSLTRDAVIDALSRGVFYASTGVDLKDVRVAGSSLTVEIQAPRGRAPSETPATYVGFQKRYRVVFVGKQGTVLSVSHENPATYSFSGSEGYVRARVEDSGGLRAWTQPVFLDGAR